MSRQRRYGLVAVVVALVAASGFLAVRSFDDPGAVSDAQPVETGGATPTCLANGSLGPGVTRAGFRDPVGDALAGHGDIGPVSVSASAGVLTVTSDVPRLGATDAVVASLDTDCDGRDDFVLRFWNDGSIYLSQLNAEGIPITDLAATTTRSGSIYTTRFASTEVGRATAFRFRMKVDTEAYDTRADLAPDDPSRSWSFGVTAG